jgi:hypothetical protein
VRPSAFQTSSVLELHAPGGAHASTLTDLFKPRTFGSGPERPPTLLSQVQEQRKLAHAPSFSLSLCFVSHLPVETSDGRTEADGALEHADPAHPLVSICCHIFAARSLTLTTPTSHTPALSNQQSHWKTSASVTNPAFPLNDFRASSWHRQPLRSAKQAGCTTKTSPVRRSRLEDNHEQRRQWRWRIRGRYQRSRVLGISGKNLLGMISTVAAWDARYLLRVRSLHYA